METIRESQVLTILNHPGWVPATPWPELESRRARLLEQIATPHQSESGLEMEYEAKRRAKQRELAQSMQHRDPKRSVGVPVLPPPISYDDLVPSEQERMIARLEQQAWVDATIAIGDEIKDVIREHGWEWQASLGAIDGLFEFAQDTARYENFIRRASSRFPSVVPPEVAGQLVELLQGIPAEAMRIQRLANWLGRELVQPLGLGFAFYEDTENVPAIGHYIDRDNEEFWDEH